MLQTLQDVGIRGQTKYLMKAILREQSDFSIRLGNSSNFNAKLELEGPQIWRKSTYEGGNISKGLSCYKQRIIQQVPTKAWCRISL